MIFNWTSKDLRNDLRTLEKMLKEETNPEIREQLYKAIVEAKRAIICEELEEQEEDYHPKALFDLYDEAAMFEMYYPMIKEFVSKLRYTMDTFSFNSPIRPWNLNLTEKDMFELMHEFFKTTTKEIKDIYDEINKCKKRIRFQSVDCYEPHGSMLFIPGLNKPYITIGIGEDKSSIMPTFAHEEGHSIGSILNPLRYTESEHSIYVEIESIFFELIGTDYFSKELNNEEIKKQQFHKMQSLFFQAEEILLERRLATAGFKQHNPDKDNIKLEDNDLIFTLKDITIGGCTFKRDINYVVSYIIAVELYELYQEDKELAIDCLKRIVQRGKEKSEYLNITGIVTPNKSLIKHKKRITRI